MKIQFDHPDSGQPKLRRKNENGMATVLFIALLAIMMVLVMVEAKSLVRLHCEVKLLEQQQIKRLDNPQASPDLPSTHP